MTSCFCGGSECNSWSLLVLASLPVKNMFTADRPASSSNFSVLVLRGHLHRPHFLLTDSLLFVLRMRDSIFFRYLTTAAALCTGSPVKNVSPLICTASAFSERYLGMPLRDDSRYQVRVYHLPSLVCCWSLKEACCRATDTPTVKLPQLPNAAIKVSGSDALPFLVFFMLCRILSLISLW